MAINFPDNPSTNQVYTVGQRKWRWSGEKWRKVQAEVPAALPSLTVDGDLVVHGTTTTLSAEELRIEDNIITLNDGTTGTPTLHAGIEVERGDSDNSQLRWNESDDRWEFSADSTTYYPVAYVPSGTVNLYAGATAPASWLMCDGSAVSRTTYSELFTAIGTTYGAGDGTTTFNVPNLSGRVPVGLDSGNTDYDALGETGGSNTHTLTSAEMPSHNHNANAGNSSSTYTGAGLDNSNNAAKNSTGNQSANHTHNFNTNAVNLDWNHGHNTGNPSANHYHGGSTSNVGDDVYRATQYTNMFGAYDIDTGGGYIHGGWSMATNYRTHAHNFNTGNVSAWHTHGINTANLNYNHSHSGSTGNNSANHTHDLTHKHNMDHNHTVSLDSTGSGTAHSIVQPYIVMNYIIKV